MSKLDEIAKYADSHDFAAEMEQGVWETDTEDDPMLTTSLRLRKSLLARVRAQAAAEHVRPSVLIRQWIEQRRDAGGAVAVEDLVARCIALGGKSFPTRRHPDECGLPPSSLACRRRARSVNCGSRFQQQWDGGELGEDRKHHNRGE